MAQMITVKCTSCGAQRKVPENTSAAIACRKCGARMAAPSSAAPAAAPARPRTGVPRGSSRRKAAAGRPSRRGKSRSSRRAPAVVEPEVVQQRGRPGRPPARSDNTPIIMTVIIGCGLLAGIFFMLASSGNRSLAPQDDGSSSSSYSSSGMDELVAATQQPWEVSSNFRSQAMLRDIDRILTLFDVRRHARIHDPANVPSDENTERKYAQTICDAMPGWIRQVNLGSGDEEPGASANEAIVVGRRNLQPAVRFFLSRSSSGSPWMVYDYELLQDSGGGGGGDEGGGGDGNTTVAGGDEEIDTGGGEDTGGGDGRIAASKRPRLAVPEYLQDYENLGDEERESVEKAIAEVLRGDPRAVDEAQARCKDVGQKSVPVLLRFLRKLDVDDANFREANELLNILSNVAPGDFFDHPTPPDLMGGQAGAVRNKIGDWTDWWKENYKKYRE